jgi:porphobilinogen synthase
MTEVDRQNVIQAGGSPFPVVRARRLRRTGALRALVEETTLNARDFLYPLFVVPGRGVRAEIASLPGQHRLSVDQLAGEVDQIVSLGIPGVILFGVTDRKDEIGSEAWRDEGDVQRAIREIKRVAPRLCVAADACFCEYTTHGHCGVMASGALDNDRTLQNLARVAVSYAGAGADVIAPSGMLDGFVTAVRGALDRAGHHEVAILAYSAKYASSFYGPFREAVDSTPSFGDRRGYQLAPGNAREGIREATLDLAEGADLVMVKPALSYLDVIARVRAVSPVPVVAYNVSGEYAALRAARERGWLDYDRAVLEVLTSIRRAGADVIITYHAKEAAALIVRGALGGPLGGET